ncbi:MAG: M15 family metallopeptidase [Hyphomonadaceae bacterium]
MRMLLLLLAAAALLALAPRAQAQARPADRFVDAAAAVPGLVIDMRYAGADNFVGRPIKGYEKPICLLTREAAAALALAQADLKPFGLGLKAFDCFRPRRAVDDFVRWARDPKALARKAEHYPGVDKGDLFRLGYIAERSGHSRGSTIDLTIIDLASGAELDMGGGYDLFDTRSWPAAAGVAPAQRAHRLLLREVMIARGFRPYEQEWWHFTLDREPLPDTYFDFPVR